MDVNHSNAEMLHNEEYQKNMNAKSLEDSSISIDIQQTKDDVSCSNFTEMTFDDDALTNTPPFLAIPTSVGSSSTSSLRSLGSRSSFDGFSTSSTSSFISLSNDKELVHRVCHSLRQVPGEIQSFDLSTKSRRTRRPLKSLQALSGLTNLVHLDLSGNVVERLKGVQVLTQLQTLAMPRNHLKFLSAPLFTLKRLKQLDLSGNFIAHLPHAFSELTTLEVLNMSGNNLGILCEVDVLKPLTNLLSCSLAANPFCRFPMYKDYVIHKLRYLERLDNVEVSRGARDRAAKRLRNVVLSQEASTHEPDLVHANEQNRLLETQSALEAENLRLKGELQVKSILLQNKSRAWSSATEQLLQLQQEVAMLNLDRQRSDSVPKDESNEVDEMELIRYQLINSSKQQPQSRLMPKRSVKKRRGSFSDDGGQLDRSLDESETDDEQIFKSQDAEYTLMTSCMGDGLKQSKRKKFADASCSPIHEVPTVIVRNFEQTDLKGDAGKFDDDRRILHQSYEDSSTPSQSDEMALATQPITSSTVRFDSSRQQRERARKRLSCAEAALKSARLTSAMMAIDLRGDEPLEMNNFKACRLSRIPHDPAFSSYKDTASKPWSISRSSLSNEERNSVKVGLFHSQSLPSSPTYSPSKIQQWLWDQQKLRFRTSPLRKPAQRTFQSRMETLLTEICSEEHPMNELKQKLVDQLDSKVQDENPEGDLAENVRNMMWFADDKKEKIETEMGHKAERTRQDHMSASSDLEIIREKLCAAMNVLLDKEILTPKLLLENVEKEAQDHTTANTDLVVNCKGYTKRVKFLTETTQKMDEMIMDQIQLKEKCVASLLAKFHECGLAFQYSSSLNETQSLNPFFQCEETSNLKLFQTMGSPRKVIERLKEVCTNQAAKNNTLGGLDTSNILLTDGGRRFDESTTSAKISEPHWQPAKLQIPELHDLEMLRSMEADIDNILPPQVVISAGRCEGGAEGLRDCDQSIMFAQENQLQAGINDPDEAGRDIHQIESLQQICQVDGVSKTDTAEILDTPLVDKVYFNEFASAESHYTRKYVVANDGDSMFLQNIRSDQGPIPAQIMSTQRIIKICERLEVAEAKSKFDPVSKIELDRQGNSRGSLKIVLLAARDLPTAHLQTKSLNPYVSLKVVYPSQALSSCENGSTVANKVFRSQTKKKSIFPVWNEIFEFTRILSLNGYLHVRVLNDRRLRHEQLVGETRIPMHTLLHQKRVVEWYPLGLDIAPASEELIRRGNIVSKLSGGAIKIQLQLYFSKVERYKQVVDELVMKYQNEYNHLPPFIVAVNEYNGQTKQVFAMDQSVQNGRDDVESKKYNPQKRVSQEAQFLFGENAILSSSPSSVCDSMSKLSNSCSRVKENFIATQGSSMHSSAEQTKSLWTMKSSVVVTKAAFEQPLSSVSKSHDVLRPSRTQSRKVKSVPQRSFLQRNATTGECFDETSPYHPSFKSAELREHSRRTLQAPDIKRKIDLTIFKRPNFIRRQPITSFPDRYIGFDNQTCERLKQIFERMDGALYR